MWLNTASRLLEMKSALRGTVALISFAWRSWMTILDGHSGATQPLSGPLGAELPIFPIRPQPATKPFEATEQPR